MKNWFVCSDLSEGQGNSQKGVHPFQKAIVFFRVRLKILFFSTDFTLKILL